MFRENQFDLDAYNQQLESAGQYKEILFRRIPRRNKIIGFFGLNFEFVAVINDNMAWGDARTFHFC